MSLNPAPGRLSALFNNKLSVGISHQLRQNLQLPKDKHFVSKEYILNFSVAVLQKHSTSLRSVTRNESSRSIHNKLVPFSSQVSILKDNVEITQQLDKKLV